MSGVSGGRYFDLPVKDVEEKISLENPAVTKLVGNRRITLWDNSYIFILLLATASAEWWIRKRSGLS